MRWLREYIEYLFVALLFLGVFFLAVSPRVSSHAPLPEEISSTFDNYANNLFDNSRVHRIKVIIPPESFAKILEFPEEKLKFPANVVIDGNLVENVSFSTRGNASLIQLAAEESERYSYKINFGKYDKSQTYFGLDELVLNNLYADPSAMRDFLAFEIMRAAGVESPLCSYTELYINGKLRGLYLAVEEIDRSFLRRNDNSADAVIFKPEALVEDRYRLRKLVENTPGGEESLGLVYESTDPNFDFEGADLVYVSDNWSDYAALFENEVTKASAHDRDYIIESLKSLETGENIEDFWDIDALIRYFVAHNFILNSDSYTGFTSHNYFLKTSFGKSTLLPWDYNLGFQSLWLSEEDMIENRVHTWEIDEPLLGPSPESRPLWRIIAENDEYMSRYHELFQELIDDFFTSGECEELIEKTSRLVRAYLAKDPTKFYPLDELDEGVDYLKRFVYYRSDSIQKQLWGLDGLEKSPGEFRGKIREV